MQMRSSFLQACEISLEKFSESQQLPVLGLVCGVTGTQYWLPPSSLGHLNSSKGLPRALEYHPMIKNKTNKQTENSQQVRNRRVLPQIDKENLHKKLQQAPYLMVKTNDMTIYIKKSQRTLKK